MLSAEAPSPGGGAIVASTSPVDQFTLNYTYSAAATELALVTSQSAGELTYPFHRSRHSPPARPPPAHSRALLLLLLLMQAWTRLHVAWGLLWWLPWVPSMPCLATACTKLLSTNWWSPLCPWSRPRSGPVLRGMQCWYDCC